MKCLDMFWSAIYITLLQSSQNYLNFHILLKRFQSKLEFWIPKHTAKLSVVVITQQDMKYNASCRNFSIETRIEHIFQLFPLLLYTIQHKFVDFKTYTISTIKRSLFFCRLVRLTPQESTQKEYINELIL